MHIAHESSLRTAIIALALLLTGPTAFAQSGAYYEPLNEKLPPGFTADIMARVRHDDMFWLQTVRVELPTAGTVSVYSATPVPIVTTSAPAQFSVNTGHFYRLRIADMPEFPGEEIYPSIEILDRLHPPAGSAANYPIPVVLTEADLKEALSGRMVTRVIYLENPRSAAQKDPLRRNPRATLEPTNNALQEAGRYGRPMMIVRIGGRVPSGPNMPQSYFGSGGTVDPGDSIPAGSGVVKLSDKKQAVESLARGND